MTRNRKLWNKILICQALPDTLQAGTIRRNQALPDTCRYYLAQKVVLPGTIRHNQALQPGNIRHNQALPGTWRYYLAHKILLPGTIRHN